MTTSSSYCLRIGLLLWLMQAGSLTAEQVWISADWSVQEQSKEKRFGRQVVRIALRKGPAPAGIVPKPIILGDSPAALDARYWKLIAEKGDKKEEIPVTVVLPTTSPEPRVKYIMLAPGKALDTGKSYTLSLVRAPGLPYPLRLAQGYSLANPDALTSVGLPAEDLKRDKNYVDGNKAFENSFVLNTGEGNGVSLRAAWGRSDFKYGSHSSFFATLSADGTYKPKDKGNYLNSIVGEIDASWNFTKEFSALRANAVEMLALTHRIEADRDFDVVNGTLGVTSWTSFGADWLDSFSRALCVIGTPPSRTPSPILALAYDYVFKINEDLATGERIREVGDHRLRVQFYWSVKLAHEFQLPLIEGKYDADVVLNLSGIQDLKTGDFLPDARVTLELAPASDDKSKPSFTLSYVNGKVTPRFENYDAILAGFKMPF